MSLVLVNIVFQIMYYRLFHCFTSLSSLREFEIFALNLSIYCVMCLSTNCVPNNVFLLLYCLGVLQLAKREELVLDYIIERKRMDDLAGSIVSIVFLTMYFYCCIVQECCSWLRGKSWCWTILLRGRGWMIWLAVL